MKARHSAGGIGVLSSLRIADFRRLWAGSVAAHSGRWAFIMGTGWLVQSLSQSPMWVGFSIFAIQVPSLLVEPVSGVLADRFQRRRLLAAGLVGNALACAGLAVLTFAGAATLPAAAVLALLFGIANSIQNTAANALLPNLVPKANLLNAVSLSGTARHGSEFIGPLLATPLLVAFGPGPVFVLCAFFYLVSLWQTLVIQQRSLPPQSPGEGFVTLFLDGLRYVTRSSMLGILILLVAFHCTLTMAFSGLLPGFVQNTLHGDTKAYGMLMTAIGLGAAVGTLALSVVVSPRWRGALFLITGLASGLALVALGLSPNPAVAMVVALAVGSSQGMFMALTLALVQSHVEDAYRGRISSLYRQLAVGTMALATWGLGALATLLTPSAVMVAAGSAFVLLMAVAGLVSVVLRALCRGEMPAVQPASVRSG